MKFLRFLLLLLGSWIIFGCLKAPSNKVKVPKQDNVLDECSILTEAFKNCIATKKMVNISETSTTDNHSLYTLIDSIQKRKGNQVVMNSLSFSKKFQELPHKVYLSHSIIDSCGCSWASRNKNTTIETYHKNLSKDTLDYITSVGLNFPINCDGTPAFIENVLIGLNGIFYKKSYMINFGKTWIRNVKLYYYHDKVYLSALFGYLANGTGVPYYEYSLVDITNEPKEIFHYTGFWGSYDIYLSDYNKNGYVDLFVPCAINKDWHKDINEIYYIVYEVQKDTIYPLVEYGNIKSIKLDNWGRKSFYRIPEGILDSIGGIRHKKAN